MLFNKALEEKILYKGFDKQVIKEGKYKLGYTLFFLVQKSYQGDSTFTEL